MGQIAGRSVLPPCPLARQLVDAAAGLTPLLPRRMRTSARTLKGRFGPSACTYKGLTKADESCQVFPKSFFNNMLEPLFRWAAVAHTDKPWCVSSASRLR